MESQLDWDTVSLPGGRTRLPQIGDLISRPGKRPKQRKTLPKGIWDADGKLLPLHENSRH